MITNLEKPVVEAVLFRFVDTTTPLPSSSSSSAATPLPRLSPRESYEFIREFMDALPSTPLKLTPGSTPAVLVYDSSKPLNGFSSLGHEAAEKVAQHFGELQDGDIVMMHARKGARRFYGGSTDLGRLRTAIHDAASARGLVPRTPGDIKPVWVYKFPMFTPNESEGAGDPGTGQGGSSGFSSTHHPFTADPLAALADHYDLVINGVEVGGGSRRIHVAEVQEYVLREVLGMDDRGVGQFAHLLEALRAGCPPHAGFAFGFDRFLSVICDVPSVRDVIAFPKNNKGEDPLVHSPSRITAEQAKTYHLLV